MKYYWLNKQRGLVLGEQFGELTPLLPGILFYVHIHKYQDEKYIGTAYFRTDMPHSIERSRYAYYKSISSVDDEDVRPYYARKVPLTSAELDIFRKPLCTEEEANKVMDTKRFYHA